MLTVNQKIYKIDDGIPSAVKVSVGELFRANITNAFGKNFLNLDEFENFLAPENEEEKRRLNHPCTGPIEVIIEDAKNISLAIHVVDIKAHRAYQCLSKSTGFLKDDFDKRYCTIYELEQDKPLHFVRRDLSLTAKPKIGFMSTFDQEIRSCGRACHNGGNLDLNFLGIGSTIYLPVNAGRARFAVGDLHICQGNGEAAGIAVEADGEVTLRAHVIDKVNFPVIDHINYLNVVGYGVTVEESLKSATENTISYLERLFPFNDWERGDIYRFTSAEGNLVMGNASGKVKTAAMSFLKSRLKNKYGFPVF